MTVLAATDAGRRGRWPASVTRLAAPPVLAWLAATALYWAADSSVRSRRWPTSPTGGESDTGSADVLSVWTDGASPDPPRRGPWRQVV